MNGSMRGSRRWAVGATGVVMAMAAVLSACGGGGAADAGASGSAAAGGGTAVALSVGPVSGFGSIVVNGVRFDDDAARVLDDNGDDAPKSSLQLGTMVEIESGRIDDSTNTAKAQVIRFGSEIKGPVESVDAATNTFRVLGQTIEVKPTTVFDDSLGTSVLTGLTGQLVEVHALFDAATNRYVATRIEKEAALAAYRLRGVVAGLDKAAKTFRIGAATISYAGLADAALPPGWADGLKVRVTLATARDSAGRYVATAISTGKRQVEDRADARVKGNVSAFTDATRFEVNGIAVDARDARVEGGPVTAGSYVEVRGRAVEGRIVATKVEVEDANGEKVRGLELYGTVSAFDATARSFVLRGVTVTWTNTTAFERGSAALLRDGVKLEVKGVLSADRKSLAATRIQFED